MSSMIQSNPMEQAETLVQHVYGLRQSCTQKLSDGVLQKVQAVRKTCMQAEATEGTPQAWRRGGGGGGGSGGTNGHGHGHGRQPQQGQGREQSFSSGAPQAWRRGGPSQSSNPSKQSSGGGQPYQPHARYVSKFTNSSVPVEKTILNKVILNKLNTFSAKNYDDVKAFLQQILDGDEKEFLQAFMSLVFEKATNEPTFCNLYAKMISELIDQYKSLSDELVRLYNEYLPIFDEPRTEHIANYDQLVQKNLEHVHRLGYSQFLSDLTAASTTGALSLATEDVTDGHIGVSSYGATDTVDTTETSLGYISNSVGDSSDGFTCCSQGMADWGIDLSKEASTQHVITTGVASALAISTTRFAVCATIATRHTLGHLN